MDSPITRAEHIEFVKRMEDGHKRNEARIKLLEEANVQNQELIASVGKMAVNMEFMVEEQRKQGLRLEALEEKPIKTYTHIKQTIITSVESTLVGGVLGALISLVLV